MNLKIGDTRQFTFKEKPYEIKEIIEPLNLEIPYIWDTGICPHCKERITRTVKHKINKIEILIEKDKTGKIQINDLIILGFSVDNRVLLVEKNEYKKVLNISKLFKEFSLEVIEYVLSK